METGRVETTLVTGGNGISKVSLSPKQELVVTSGWGRGGPFLFWNLSTRESVDMVNNLELAEGGAKLVGFSPEGSLMAYKLIQGIGIRDFAKRATRSKVPSDRFFAPSCIVFSPSGNEFAVGALPSISIVDVRQGEVRKTRPLRHLLRVTSVAWSSDGLTLASAGYEGIVKLWDPKPGELLMRLDQTRVPDDIVTVQPSNEAEAAETATDRRSMIRPKNPRKAQADDNQAMRRRTQRRSNEIRPLLTLPSFAFLCPGCSSASTSPSRSPETTVSQNGTQILDAEINQNIRPRSAFLGLSNWHSEAKGMEFRNLRVVVRPC